MAFGFVSWGLVAWISYVNVEPVHFVLLYSTAGLSMLLAFAFLKKVSLPTRMQKGILGISLLGFLFLVPSTPSYDNDLYRYVWDGKVTLERGHPYGIAPSDYRLIHLRDDDFSQIGFRNTPTVYPPVAELAFFLSALAGKMAPYFLKLILLLAHAALLMGIQRILQSRKMHFSWILLYAWNPILWKEFANSGHIDLLGVAFLFYGLLLARKKKTQTLLLLLASGIKPIAALSFFLIWQPHILGALLLFGGVCFWNLPEVFQGISQFARFWVFYPFLFEPLTWFSKILTGTEQWARWIAWVPVFLVLSISNRISQKPSVRWTLVFLAWLFFSPTINPWYAIWVIPFWLLEARMGLATLSIFLIPSYLYYENQTDPVFVRWVSFFLLSCKLIWEEFFFNFKK